MATIYPFICWALYKNFKVFRDYSRQVALGAIAAIIAVLVLPPKVSCKSLVSFDYRYGGTAFGLERQLITFPSVVSDKLIFLSY